MTQIQRWQGFCLIHCILRILELISVLSKKKEYLKVIANDVSACEHNIITDYDIHKLTQQNSNKGTSKHQAVSSGSAFTC